MNQSEADVAAGRSWSALRLAAGVTAAGLTGAPFAQATALPCALRLRVKLSPEVPDARDQGFLSSLTGGPGYRLTWIRDDKVDMAVILKLTAAEPEYRCDDEVERIAKDARVLEVKILR